MVDNTDAHIDVSFDFDFSLMLWLMLTLIGNDESNHTVPGDFDFCTWVTAQRPAIGSWRFRNIMFLKAPGSFVVYMRNCFKKPRLKHFACDFSSSQ